MVLGNFTVGIIFLSQSTVGILGNISLLSHYLIIYYNEFILKPTDILRTHLITANLLIILSKGVPCTMAAFGMKEFIHNFICKLVLYIQRLGRSMSLGTTCFLSIYQAIAISSQKFCSKNYKVTCSNYVGRSISLCWVIYITINFIFPVLMHIKMIQNNVTKTRDFLECSHLGRDKIVELLYIALLVFPEVLFSVLIIWSSSSMIVFLYKHKEHTQYIHNMSLSRRTSPESRATKNILLLVTTFVAFYTLSSILHGFAAVLYKPSLWLLNITAITSMCFPTLSPFYMSYKFHPLKFFLLWINSVKIK